MSFEIKMIIIYTVIFSLLGLFIWLFVVHKNKKDRENVDKEYDYATDNEFDEEDETLSDYEDYDDYITIPERYGTSTEFDSIDDFLSNFSYREDDYDVVKEKATPKKVDYTVSINPIKAASKHEEVINVLIGKKSYIFLANGNKLDIGTKIILRIDDKDYNGVVVKTNYERDLSTLDSLPKNLNVVKVINN